MELLEEMNSAAEPGLVEEAGQPGPGCREVKPEERELTRWGESTNILSGSAPGSWESVWAAVRGTDLQMDRAVWMWLWPLSMHLLQGIQVPVIPGAVGTSLSPVLHLEVVTGIQKI